LQPQNTESGGLSNSIEKFFLRIHFLREPATKLKCERSDSGGEYFIFLERAG
jgi:hypothetical protein